MRDFSDFDKIKISLASPERIREWSYGEVKKPETINYRTLKPEREGLFCEKIFGTTKEWECSCGKFKGIRYKGVVCDRCGVEVAHFKVRRERMGHIELAAPVSHIWYYKSVPSRIGLLLGISVNELRNILYYEKYIVIDPGDTELKEKQILSEDEYLDYRETYGPNFTAEMGASAVKQLLDNIDLEEESAILREKMNEKGLKSDSKILKRLEIIEDFRTSGNKPAWMILEVIPVIPPELRPMVPLDGGRFATSDLNDLYRRVINRNNRLRKLLSLKAPEIIIRNEKRMLQEAVDALFDNSRRKRVVKGPGNRPLRSLSDMLKGKQGRFRQNLLGKRVDYSGRSVIVIGPKLKLYQCGLPKKMALELFKPFIMKGLVEKELVYNIKSAKKMVEKEDPEVWGVLEEVIKEHPVMLNRAPTLHRLGIQAFEPQLVEGKAIQLHPLVCTAFNADFDGDQMAVHVPLSAESQIECWLLMLSARNLLNPANGRPIVGPTKDITLGIAYLTKERQGFIGSAKCFSSFEEACIAYDNGVVDLQEKIKVRYKPKKENDKYEWLETTVGRIMFNKVLPDKIGFRNQYLKERDVVEVISEIFKEVGYYKTVVTLDRIKDLGFKYATYFGASIGIDDMKIPKIKKKLIDEADKAAKDLEKHYRSGAITTEERHNKIVELWNRTTDKVTNEMMEELRKDQNGFNPLYMMQDSGARGSKQQIRQFAGMRGIMAKPSGDMIEIPVKSNFKEGLTVLEYFNSTHGARKGLADTALKTADAGYLTRRLVDIAQDVVVTEVDCGTINGLEISAIKEGDNVLESLQDRIIGRVTLDPIINPRTNEVIVEANEEINEEQAKIISEIGIEKVRIRTVLTCESKSGVCVKCYGRNLATNKTVEIGEAIGIIAAQSIGQPGTQLTMRTFHIGGVASNSVEEQELRRNYPCIIKKLPEHKIKLEDDDTKKISLIEKGTSEFSELKVKEGDKIKSGDVIGIDINGKEIKFEKPVVGTVSFSEKYKEEYLTITLNAKYILSRKGDVILQKILLEKKIADLKEIKVKNGDKVLNGDIIAIDNNDKEMIWTKGAGDVEFVEDSLFILEKEDKKSLKTGAYIYYEENDIVPANELIAEFDAFSEPIVSEMSGLVVFRDIVRGVTLKIIKDSASEQDQESIADVKDGSLVPRIVIVNAETGEEVNYSLSPGTTLNVEDGEEIKAGTILARVSREQAKTKDITGGLPRVQELFEARKPKDACILAEQDGKVRLGEKLKGKNIIYIDHEYPDENGDIQIEPIKHIIPLGKRILVRDGELVTAGTQLCDGPVNPHDILRIDGDQKLQEYLLNEIQEVYRLQGVYINDKHIGVIIRQMLKKVEISDVGDTKFIINQPVDKFTFKEENARVAEEGGKQAIGKPILLGITKASLNIDSWISAASFQETTKVLTNAAIKGKTDYLNGLKENVIIGHLVPAGTGIKIYENLEVSSPEDENEIDDSDDDDAYYIED